MRKMNPAVMHSWLCGWELVLYAGGLWNREGRSGLGFIATDLPTRQLRSYLPQPGTTHSRLKCFQPPTFQTPRFNTQGIPHPCHSHTLLQTSFP